MKTWPIHDRARVRLDEGPGGEGLLVVETIGFDAPDDWEDREVWEIADWDEVDLYVVVDDPDLEGRQLARAFRLVSDLAPPGDPTPP